jgi:MFS-type transporter involved in bile tolerance (Atg22 family)
MHYQWKSHWTVTISGKTRCVLLHYDSPKYSTPPLNKFIQALKVVKLFWNTIRYQWKSQIFKIIFIPDILLFLLKYIGRPRVRDPRRWMDFFLSIYLILAAALGPGVYATCNRDEYRKHLKKCFWGVKCGRCVGLTTLPPSMSRLLWQCGILNIS